MTKPSRSTLYGREAVSGESLRLDSACIAANAASVSPWMTASEPPAMMTSVSPERRWRRASPMAWLEVAQAEETA